MPAAARRVRLELQPVRLQLMAAKLRRV